MRRRNRQRGAGPLAPLCLTTLALLLGSTAHAENIDPDADGSRFAWAENAGWLNAQPNGPGGQGIQVEDALLTGWAWSEGFGWISLSCANTGSCGAVDYGVANDGTGGLTGFGWAENIGWVSFSCANTGSCAEVDYGVTIDPQTGEFAGEAWAENAGWLRLRGTVPSLAYGVKTAWRGVGAVPAASLLGLATMGAALLTLGFRRASRKSPAPT